MTSIERIKCDNGNVYLVSNGDNAVLIDTYRESYRDMILEKCKTKKVSLIILTHGHVDHIQNAAFLSKELNAPIAMHKGDYELTKDNWAQPLSAGSLLGKIILMLSKKSFKADRIDPFEPHVFLSEGYALDDYGVPATVIELPGHTKGSIGVLVEDADVIVGDALMNMVYPTKSPLYCDKENMKTSAAKISALGDVMVYFGHGKPVKNRNW
ncbi:MAG: MBL fold metallo-hydrolase [Oscillospiraceae bacterium]|nr:MBL fold metallo-hydrolase [Oscillospiraceae bacterium]